MKVDTARLNRCLNPSSIAVIGGAEAARVIQQCHKLGFRGDIWPVNPQRDSMQGVRCYRSVDALPEAPDAAFIAIPAESTITLVSALAQRGAGGAVCYASGFKETGQAGNNRQQRLVEAAGTMPIIGPNCYGFINLLCGAALWPDYHGATRVQKGVAIFSQSGNVSLNLSMQRRLLPLAWLVTLGNQAVFGVEEGIAAALDSPCITAIGIHIEGLNDLPRFAKLAEQAMQRGIPIVALKAGRSVRGARITLSHTATLAGSGALYDALFVRLGIGQTSTPEEFIESLKLVSMHGALSSKRIASMSCSGGEATLVADLAERYQVEFPGLEDSHRQAVQLTLNEHVRVDNPLDYHTFIWGDSERMQATFSAMLAGDFALTLLILDTPDTDDAAMEIWLRTVHAFIAACRATASKGALVASLSENLPSEVGQLLLENGIAALQGLAQSLAAVQVACSVGEAWAQMPRTEMLWFSGLPVGDSEAHQTLSRLDEHQAKQLLARAGFSIPQSVVADTAESAVVAAGQLGYPVVLKSLTSTIVHKTEAGAVVVNLQNNQQVHAHATRMLSDTSRLLVENMVEDTVFEMLLGIGYDQQFGHYLIIGFGGVLVELIGDRQLLLLPVDEPMIRNSLNRLKTAALLNGYRGQARADVESVIQCALRLNQLLAEQSATICEIEINPLLVQSENNGAVVADALITMRTPRD